MAVAEAPLRVTTRPFADDVAHRYVLSWARVEGDSLAGIVAEEYQRVGAGRWSLVPQTERARRVAVRTADIADVSRRKREPSATRTGAMLLGMSGLAYVIVWGILNPVGGT